MTERQWIGVAMLAVGVLVLVALVWAARSRSLDDGDRFVQELWMPPEDETEVVAPVVEWPEEDWDEKTLAKLYEDPEEERPVLAVAESAEEWRRRMEAEDNDWRLRVQNTLGLAVDFGERLELVA